MNFRQIVLQQECHFVSLARLSLCRVSKTVTSDTTSLPLSKIVTLD